MLGMLKMLPLVIALAGVGYMYHTQQIAVRDATIAQQQTNNERLRANVATLEVSLEREQQALRESQENLERQLQAVGELTAKTASLTAERDEYLSIFKRHDMTRLARARPGLIEPRINKGTADVFRAIENDSKEIEDADS